jgi:hypothetical protein
MSSSSPGTQCARRVAEADADGLAVTGRNLDRMADVSRSGSDAAQGVRTGGQD